MSKRERDRAGYLLPEIIDPEDCVCVCVPIPNDPGHIRAFLGQLDYLGYWWTWERDPLKKGTEAARVWREVVECVRWRLDNDCGCGGGSQPTIPPQYRYNENGQVEVSFDGGETWEDGSNYDERQLVVLNRPLPEGITDPQCVGASNITRETKKLVDEIFTQINNGQTAVNIAPSIIALLIALGLPSGGLTLFLVVVYGLIAAAFSAIDAGLEGSFDSSFWDDYTCFWFCELGEDLEVSQSMIDAVFAKVKDRLGGNIISSSVIGNVFESMGNKMLTNAARSGTFTTFDCGTCQCFSCADDPIVTFGSLNPETGVITSAAGSTSGQQWVEVYFGSIDNVHDACLVNSINQASGVFQAATAKLQGSNTFVSPPGGVAGKCCHAVRIVNIFNQAFSVTINRSDCTE
jgi:hypothetical protein